MIHLVLERARQQALAFHGAFLAFEVETSDDGKIRPGDGGVEPRHAQAAFFLELHPLALDELRVDERDEPARIPAQGEIDDEDAQRHADLRRRQTDAGCRVHRLDHVLDQVTQVGRDLIDALRGLVQDIFFSVFDDGTNHGVTGDSRIAARVPA